VGTGSGHGTGTTPSTAAAGFSGGGLTPHAPQSTAETTPGGHRSVDPITLAAGATTHARSSALAFTGAGGAVVTTALGGLGLVLLGAYLLVRRRTTRAARWR
jgi:hypothetical protein